MKRTIIILALSLGLISGLISIIIQAAAAQQCLYTINSTSASFPAAGGAGTINVFTSSECRWTAVSSADWIEITSGGSGFGNGTVGYSVAENTGAARIGTITVVGIAFTVSSAAALSQTPDPVRRLPGLQSLTFYERTGGTAPNPFTFAAGGPELAQRLPSPLGPANSDFRGTTREFYDVFYSDQDGTFNPDGRYVSIECVFDQQDGALNIAEVSLNFVGGRVENFNRLASFLALGSTAAPATAANAVDGDLQTHTTLGDTLGQSGRLRLTLSFIPSTPCTYT
ncbi:MAG TPA: BACON domain-containing protein, partial [Blastocatellia bacterium]|nr:BACON domain-containing protein [Blastocatellia bacterium]